MSATIRTSGLPDDFTPLPHVQAFCDAVLEADLADSFGTYAGHDPTPERATDIFVDSTSRTQGNSVCSFALDHWEYYGIYYIIFNRRIYNKEIGEYWRPYNGSSPHTDHVHVSYYSTADATPIDSDGGIPVAQADEILAVVGNMQAQMNNVYAYLFNDRKGEDRGGAGLDNADLQTNAAVDEIRKAVKALQEDFKQNRVSGVDQDKIVGDIVTKLKKDLRGIV